MSRDGKRAWDFARPRLVGVASLIVGLAGVVRGQGVAPPERPNVIIVLADDLGYGELGCYGHPRFRTPNLDRMAAEGVRLTQFNTPMPFCAPTRASLMTGRYPFRCGLTSNPTPDGPPQADNLGLPGGEVTLAQVFKQAGYATGMVGKWHLGHKRPELLPTRRGFDEYLGIPYSNDMRPVQLLDGEDVVEYPVVQATLTRRYTERALKFLERNRDHPFFFYFAHAMPHKPLACSEAFYKKSGAGLYGDALAELDWSVGRVLEKLKGLGLDGRTLVVFTSDNGPWYGGSTGGLRGMKGTTWEGGFRVPFIARWPGRLPAGKVRDAPAVMMDLFATALAAADIPPPGDRVIDGKDLLPLLSGKAESVHDVIFGHQGPRLATVRDGRWKLHVLPARDNRIGSQGGRWIDPRGPDGVTILAPYEQSQPDDYPGLRTGDPTGPLSLFDLANDPAEQHNVAAAHPDVVARLKEHYDRAAKEVPVAQRQPTGAPSNDQLDPQIQPADWEKYKLVQDAKDWENPYLIILPEGIEVISKAITRGRKVIPATELLKTLLDLPVGAWPYGRVIAVQEIGIRSDNDDRLIEHNKAKAEQVLKSLRIQINWWPSA